MWALLHLYVLYVGVLIMDCHVVNLKVFVPIRGILLLTILSRQPFPLIKLIFWNLCVLHNHCVGTETMHYPSHCYLSWKKMRGIKPWCCSSDICFPGMHVSRTHIAKDACFPAHISLMHWWHTSHSDICFPGMYVSPHTYP